MRKVSKEWGDHKQGSIARRVGVSTGTVNRWVLGENKSPQLDHVLRFADAYERPRLEALLMAQYVTTDRVEEIREQFLPRADLDAYSTLHLAEEVARRLRSDIET